MNIEDLTIGQARKISELVGRDGGSSISDSFIGHHVIIRTYSAGVHFGKLERRQGTEVMLSNARRIWRWAGAFTLNEIAVAGIDVKESKLSDFVPRILLTQAIEVIPCEPSVVTQLIEAAAYET